MALTDVDVVNMALGLLSEASIDTLDGDDMISRLCNTHYDQTREEELGGYAWVFAIFRAEVIGSDLVTGSGTLNWVYEVPEDALRPLPLTYDGEPNGLPIRWQQEAGLIYSDQASPRIIRYIANLIDPNDWDAHFTRVLYTALAIKLAFPLTHIQRNVEMAQRAYDKAVTRAFRVNAIQTQGHLYEASWSAQRGDTRYWRA